MSKDLVTAIARTLCAYQPDGIDFGDPCAELCCYCIGQAEAVVSTVDAHRATSRPPPLDDLQGRAYIQGGCFCVFA